MKERIKVIYNGKEMYFHYPPTYGEWYSVMTERLSKKSRNQKINNFNIKYILLKFNIVFYKLKNLFIKLKNTIRQKLLKILYNKFPYLYNSYIKRIWIKNIIKSNY